LMMRNRRSIGYFSIIVIVVIVIAMFTKNYSDTNKIEEVKFSDMAKEFKSENVIRFEANGARLEAELKDGGIIVCYAANGYELDWLETKYVLPQMVEGKVKEVSSPKPKEGGVLASLLPSLFLIIALVVVMYYFMNSAGGGGGKVMQFGKSRAKLHRGDAGKKVTYEDVAGLDEEREELSEVVDFLKNPTKYNELGARIPQGILLVGPPGTGKTYLSKATAGEADVPFFTISGSDFVEMFVGVGASRVRDLFEQAKKNAPCIVFIDEIDAVGRSGARASAAATTSASRRSTSCLWRWTGSVRTAGSSSSRPRTGRTFWIPRCSGRGVSTGRSSSASPTSRAARRSSASIRATSPSATRSSPRCSRAGRRASRPRTSRTC